MCRELLNPGQLAAHCVLQNISLNGSNGSALSEQLGCFETLTSPGPCRITQMTDVFLVDLLVYCVVHGRLRHPCFVPGDGRDFGNPGGPVLGRAAHIFGGRVGVVFSNLLEGWIMTVDGEEMGDGQLANTLRRIGFLFRIVRVFFRLRKCEKQK